MITVFGLGFVGLTTALYFSHRNKKVYGIDINEEKKETISNSKLPFYEPKLEEILNKELNNNFYISNDTKKDINNSEYIFICVDTDMLENNHADLSSIKNVLNEILDSINISTYKVIVIKSSIPPTTTRDYILPIFKDKGLVIGKDIGLCINPEFIREGCGHEEILNPDRIILGTEDELTKNKMNELYYEDNLSIFNVNYQTAEFSKYLSNSFLGSVISFSNEMSMVADSIGDIDIKSSFDIVKNDKRWNNSEMRNYLHPIGKYGGYCLVKDIPALYEVSKDNNFDSKFLKDTISINDNLEEYIVSQIIKETNKDMNIGILGLSFKPNSDDVRNTSSYYVIKKLKEKGYENIYAYDPVSINNFKNMYNVLEEENYIYDYKDIIDKSDVLIILTIWKEFKNIKDITDKKVMDFTHKI